MAELFDEFRIRGEQLFFLGICSPHWRMRSKMFSNHQI
jgi:hypothetical protein